MSNNLYTPDENQPDLPSVSEAHGAGNANQHAPSPLSPSPPHPLRRDAVVFWDYENYPKPSRLSHDDFMSKMFEEIESRRHNPDTRTAGANEGDSLGETKDPDEVFYAIQSPRVYVPPPRRFSDTYEEVPTKTLLMMEEPDLRRAAREGNERLVRQLLAKGVDPNAQGPTGEWGTYILGGFTPLIHAAYGGHTGCARALLEAGADLNITHEHDETPAHCAAYGDNPETLALLLHAGAQVNAINTYGNTPLHRHAWNGKSGCVSVLVRAGADLRLRNKDNLTPAGLAKSKFNTRFLEELEKERANYNVGIAFMTSNPIFESGAAWSGTRLEDERRLIISTLSRVQRHIRVCVELLVAGVRVLHLTGHSSDSTSNHTVVLEGEEGQPQEVDPKDILSKGKLPQVVVLSMCSFAAASAFVECGIPHVVFIPYLSDQNYHIFTSSFYESLAAGSTVSSAFERSLAMLSNTVSDHTLFSSSFYESLATGSTVLSAYEQAMLATSDRSFDIERLPPLLLPGHADHDVIVFPNLPYGSVIDVSHSATLIGAPPPAEYMIGRAREVSEVIRRLQTSRLVCIAGPNGIGKATLASHVAHYVSSRRLVDFVIFIDIRRVHESDSVRQTLLQRISTALSVEEGVWPGTFANTQALIVLRGADQCLPEVSEFVEQALTQTAHLKFIVTSTARPEHGSMSAATFTLSGLSQAEAALLFQRHASALDEDTTRRQLQSHPLIMQAASNPALSQMIAHTLCTKEVLDRFQSRGLKCSVTATRKLELPREFVDRFVIFQIDRVSWLDPGKHPRECFEPFMGSMEHINCQGCNIPSGLILDIIQQNSALSSLRFSDNGLKCDDVVTIVAALEAHPGVHEVRLPENDIADRGAAAFTELLRTSDTVSVLDLRQNSIQFMDLAGLVTTAPGTFQKRFQFVSIELAGNTGLRSPPAAVCRSAETLAQFLSDLQQDAVRLDEIRLMVVGHGGVGKTTLRRTLLTNERLYGADVSQWSVDLVQRWLNEKGFSQEIQNRLSDCDGRQLLADALQVDDAHLAAQIERLQTDESNAVEANEPYLYVSSRGTSTLPSALLDQCDYPMRVEVADFAGQMEYLRSHSLFFSATFAIYLICSNLVHHSQQRDHNIRHLPGVERLGKEQPNAAYGQQVLLWLRTLKSIGGISAPVRIALTFKDKYLQLPGKKMTNLTANVDAMSEQLQRFYPEWFPASPDEKYCYSINASADPTDADPDRARLLASLYRAASAFEDVLVPRAYEEVRKAVRAYADNLRTEGRSLIVPYDTLMNKVSTECAAYLQTQELPQAQSFPFTNRSFVKHKPADSPPENAPAHVPSPPEPLQRAQNQPAPDHLNTTNESEVKLPETKTQTQPIQPVAPTQQSLPDEVKVEILDGTQLNEQTKDGTLLQRAYRFLLDGLHLLELKRNGQRFAILQPVEWLARVMECFVVDPGHSPIVDPVPNHTGIYSWTDIRAYKTRICGANASEADLRMVLEALTSLDVCCHVPAGSLEALSYDPDHRSDYYLFPGAIEAWPLDKILSHWETAVKGESHVFGCRVKVANAARGDEKELDSFLPMTLPTQYQLHLRRWERYCSERGVVPCQMGQGCWFLSDATTDSSVLMHSDAYYRWLDVYVCGARANTSDVLQEALEILHRLTQPTQISLDVRALHPSCLRNLREHKVDRLCASVALTRSASGRWSHDVPAERLYYCGRVGLTASAIVHGNTIRRNKVAQLQYIDDQGNFADPGALPSMDEITAEMKHTAERKDIFLSHRGPDYKDRTARPLWFILQQCGVSSFLDADMPVGQINVNQMAWAAHTCRVAVVIISENFQHSKHCIRELNVFLQRQQLEPPDSFTLLLVYDVGLLGNGHWQSIGNITSLERVRGISDWEFLLDFLLPKVLTCMAREPPSPLRCYELLRTYIDKHRGLVNIPFSLEPPAPSLLQVIQPLHQKEEEKIARRIPTLSCDLHEWLVAERLDCYAALLTQEDVLTFDDLRLLNEQDLQALGVTKVLHVKKLARGKQA